MQLIAIDAKNLFVQGLVLFASDESKVITAYRFINTNRLDHDLIAYYFSEEVLDLQAIGSISVDNKWLNTIHVDETYRRLGIASQLVQLAIQHLNLKRIRCFQETLLYLYGLTPNGEKFIAACIIKKIILADMCICSDEVTPPRLQTKFFLSH